MREQIKERIRKAVLFGTEITRELIIACACLWEAGFWAGISGGRISSPNAYFGGGLNHSDPTGGVATDVIGGDISFSHFGLPQFLLSVAGAIVIYLLTKVIIAMAAEKLEQLIKRLPVGRKIW
jgi:hypothetical protein